MQQTKSYLRYSFFNIFISSQEFVFSIFFVPRNHTHVKKFLLFRVSFILVAGEVPRHDKGCGRIQYIQLLFGLQYSSDGFGILRVQKLHCRRITESARWIFGSKKPSTVCWSTFLLNSKYILESKYVQYLKTKYIIESIQYRIALTYSIQQFL